MLVASVGAASAQSPEELAEGGHWKRVRAIVEPRVTANPGDAQAQWLLSRARQAFGELDAALSAAERAVAANPRRAEYHVQLANACGALAQDASWLKQLSLGRRYKAEVDAAVALDANSIDGLYAQMQFLWRAPGIMGGDQAKAREVAQRIGRIDASRGYLVQAELANLERQQDRLDGLYRKAVEANRRNYNALLALANFSASRPSPDGDLVDKLSREAMALAPDRVGAYATLGRFYARQQRIPDLEAILAEAERLVADNPTPFLAAASTLLAAGKDLPRAESYLRKYLAQPREGNATSYGVARWRLGLVLEKEGRRKDAVAELEAAVRLEPKRDDIKKDLARVKALRRP
jgi:cytochrome c-type biogenesis protein CcmH/NrfG